MKKSHIVAVGCLVAVGVIFAVVLKTDKASDSLRENDLVSAAVVYKTPACGCCHVYAEYLKREGVSVEVRDVTDLAGIKRQYGIPPQLESCHTSVIGEYVVEGHVPLEVVEKLLAEKPDIKGIALPGMPAGSPGMPGLKVGPWTVYALARDGSFNEFMQY